MSREKFDAKVRSPRRTPTLQEVLENPNIEKFQKNKVEINILLRKSRLSEYHRRSSIDRTLANSNLDLEKHFTDTTNDLGKRYQRHDENDILDTHPSYRKLHVPFHILSRERYTRNKLNYEKQFRHEIQKLIDFQSSALEASYFVRLISYTTLWPPLHNHHELEHTSKIMFQLTPKEKRRLDYIMTHEFY